ncbi:MAG: hypothetical protein ACPG6V_03165 [Flavobacteriales bacterium]
MKYIVFILLFLSLLSCENLFKYNRLKPIPVRGEILNAANKSPLPSHVSFYKNNTLYKEVVCNTNGEFSIDMEVNTDSLVVVVQPLPISMSGLGIECPERNVYKIKAPNKYSYLKLEILNCKNVTNK